MNHSELFNRQVGNLLIAYQDAGEGSPVLLAHCSSASHKEWSFLEYCYPDCAREFCVTESCIVVRGRAINATDARTTLQ